MVVDVAPVLSELSELPATLLTLPLQVLLHPALLAVRGFLHVSPEQGFLEELLPAHVTPEDTDTLTAAGQSAETCRLLRTRPLCLVGSDREHPHITAEIRSGL